MRAWKYYSAFAFVPLNALAFQIGGLWTFAFPLVIFGVLPAIELALPPDPGNLDAAAESLARSTRLYDAALYLVAPAQWSLLLLFLSRLSGGEWGILSMVGAVWTMGLCCGIFGINVAHELGHRHKPFERFLSKTLLVTSLYLHFFIEHNRGHHVRIATDEDPASARFGESLYRFWARSMVGGWLSAWELERRRLEKKGRRWLGWENQMLRFQVVQVSLVGAVWGFSGLRATLGFLAAALLGGLLLETVNYIEHYGLRRRRLEDGRWERVSADHSWNSDHQLGRLLLFELTRHSDHHLHAGRKYQVLRHLEHAPQMPTGYPGMMTLALLPPLWFRVVHPLIPGGEKAGAGAGVGDRLPAGG